MPRNWSKGFTKETHPSLKKTSETMRRKRIDNFFRWREQMKVLGSIPASYPALKQNGNLAELIGVVLGDGHLGIFPRCDALLIFSNANNPGFVRRYVRLVQLVFSKKPNVRHESHAKCFRISLYQKNIAHRLNMPLGSKKGVRFDIPPWIYKSKQYSIRYLRGLYEAEGSFCEHAPTSTYKLLFSNTNESLLENVNSLLKRLGFHPNRSGYKIQVSRKEEVYRLKHLLHFREY